MRQTPSHWAAASVISAPVTLNLPPLIMNDEIDGSCGSTEDPCVRLYLPNWMKEYHKVFQNTEGYSIDTQGAKQISNWWYNTVDYGSPVFRARMKQFLTEAAARYNDDPPRGRNSGGNRLSGRDPAEQKGEKGRRLGAGAHRLHEKLISCDKYRSYVREITEHAYSVFTKKPIYLMAGPAPCANYASEKWRHELLYNPVAGWEVVSPKKLIGFSINREQRGFGRCRRVC